MSADLPASSTAANGETPILHLFRKNRELVEALNSSVNLPDEEKRDEALFAAAQAIEDTMLAMPCTCAADFAAKAIAATACDTALDWQSHPLWIEARALTGCAA